MSPDFKDLLSEFNAHGVEYLVVGALAKYGAPLQDLSVQDLSTPGIVYQIGVAPLRIDVLTGIDAVEFEEAWRERVTTRFADQSVSVLSAAHLIRNKRAVGRAQDIADLEWLERSEKE